MTLEIDEFEDLVSVNEIEPANDHTLILVFHHRYVMVSHLLRKEKLVEFFKNVGLYKDDPQIHVPPEAIGMYNPDVLNQVVYSESDLSPEHPCIDSSVLFTNSEHATRDSSHRRTNGGRGRDREEDDDEEEERNPWDNKLEQDRHIQRQIRQQSVLNPVQLLSSIQQERAIDMNRHTNSTEDFKQLGKFPSSTARDRKPAPLKTQDGKEDGKDDTSTKPATISQGMMSSSVSNLKLLFPNHNDEQLVSILAKCDYDLDSAISAILGEDNLANAFPN